MSERRPCIWCGHYKDQHFYTALGCAESFCNCPGYTVTTDD